MGWDGMGMTGDNRVIDTPIQDSPRETDGWLCSSVYTRVTRLYVVHYVHSVCQLLVLTIPNLSFMGFQVSQRRDGDTKTHLTSPLLLLCCGVGSVEDDGWMLLYVDSSVGVCDTLCCVAVTAEQVGFG